MAAGCVVVLLGMFSLPFSYAVNGWALSVLWQWFMVSTFGAPPLSVPAAIGLAIIAGYLTDKGYQKKESSDDDEAWVEVLSAIGYAFLRPLMALATGWIVLQFMS